MSLAVNALIFTLLLEALEPPEKPDPRPDVPIEVAFVVLSREEPKPEEPGSEEPIEVPDETEVIDEEREEKPVEPIEDVDENSDDDLELDETANENDKPPTVNDLDAELLVGTDSGGASTSRTSALGARGAGKATAIERYGGSSETESAVGRGLRWLSKHQDRDGGWSPHNFSRHCDGPHCTHPGIPEHEIGITALATLAFLGAGFDGTGDDPYDGVVRRAIDHLIAQQDSRGCFPRRDGHYMYSHAIATLCLVEICALTKDLRYQRSALLGLRFLANSQQPGGGWDYTTAKTQRNDLSVTGWVAMAFRGAQKAKLPVDEDAIANLRSFLSRAVRRNGTAIYADRGTGEGRGGIGMVSVGLLSRIYTGSDPEDDTSRRAATMIVRREPNPDGRYDWDRTYQSMYGWYYATLALFQVGGDHWQAWNTYLIRDVLPLQRSDGHMDGSWDADPNWIGGAGGRVTATALGVLIFESYYRYLRESEATAPPRDTLRSEPDR